jgi:formylmethanofuran dehydrogenase subunit C
MPTILTLKQRPTVPLEAEAISPDVFAPLKHDAVRGLPVIMGKRGYRLDDFFDVEGDGSEDIAIRGDVGRVKWIGKSMTHGRVTVTGDAGMHLGAYMKGGTIEVSGNASDWVGGEMRGGLIHVRGRAGHLVGSAYRGSPKGMTRGTILIGGDAGNEIGHSMRRGLIAIGGNIGDLAGMNMLAGSILVFGTSGIRHGAGMKRGTLAFLGPEAPPMLPTFRRACRFRPDALVLMFRELQRLEFVVPDELFECGFDLYNGDLLEGGRGEVLLRGDSSLPT